MSVEYERWLVARGNVFSPGADAILKLIAKLRAERWIVDPSSADLGKLDFTGLREQRGQKTGAYAVRRIDNTFGADRDGLLAKIAASTESLPAALDARWLDDPNREDVSLVWNVSSREPVLKYPLTSRPDGPVSYKLEVHRAADFVYPISENIDPLPSECSCDNDLSFDWDPEEIENPFGATTGIWTSCGECSRTFDPSKESAKVTNPFDGSEEDVAGGCAYRFAIKVDCGKSFVRDPKLAFAPELVALIEQEFGRGFYEVGSAY
jgi:hypothetical protein